LCTGKSAFNSAALTALEISGVEAGQVKSSGGLTFLQIDGAGHMVPMDQPAGSAAAIRTLL
jgi:carboxypeptidase C (cathepsin A)